jgi:hypothetical protein
VIHLRPNTVFLRHSGVDFERNEWQGIGLSSTLSNYAAYSTFR